MTTIVTRQQKGSPLTDAELDANFTNLNSAKLEDGNVRSLTDPSLVLDFTNDVLDTRISFTRSSTGTYTNKYGVLSTAATNTARFDYDPITYEPKGLLIEEQRVNLLPYSQQFDVSAWGKSRSFVIANAVMAPDGSLSGAKLIGVSGTSSTHDTNEYFTGTDAATYTLSVYAKAAELNWILVADNTTFKGRFFNLSTGTIGGTGAFSTPIASAITPVGNGWYRCSITWVQSGTTVRPLFCLATSDGTYTYTADGVSGVYLWGAQCELGAFATSYIPTLLTYSGRGSTATYVGDNGLIQTAGSGVARYQRNALGGSQLLLEGAGTNLLTYTNDFTNNWAYAFNGAIVFPNATTSPDGLYTADKIILAAADYRYQAYATTTQTSYTGSIWLKADAPISVGLRITNNAGTEATVTTCNVTTTWQRFSASKTMTVALTNVSFGLEQRTAIGGPNVAATVYVWGAQLETGSVATSYIPSTESFTSRSANATFYDASTTALAEQNLALYSQQFDQSSTWNTTLTNVVSDYAFAPDFSPTSDLISFNDAGSYIYQTINTGLITGKTYTFSCWLWSQGGKSNVGMRMTANSQANDETYSTISLNSGLTRFSITRTFTSSDTSIRIGFDNRVTQGGDAIVGNFIAWGAQLEQRANVSSYTPTTTFTISNTIPRMLTASANTARYDFDPVTRVSKGLVLEPQATNLITYSSDYRDVNWGKVCSSIIPNINIAPDGTLTASKLVEDNTLYNTHDIRKSYLLTNSGTNTYTMSAYVKKAERSWIYFELLDSSNSSNRARAWFDLTNGVVGTGGTAGSGVTYINHTITSVGNGWYRITLTGSVSVSGFMYFMSLTTNNSISYYDGDGYSGAFVWGTQIESGSVATSYIPTLGSQVTRTADIGTSVAQSRAADVYSSAQATRTADFVSMTGNNVSSWYNIQNGTFYTEAERRNNVDPSTNFHVFTISDGTNQNYYKIRFVGTNYATQTYCVSKGVTQFGAGGINGSTPSLGEYKKCALSIGSSSAFYDTGTYRGSSNGVPIPVNINKMAIGSDYTAGSQFLNGCIKRIVYYPKQLTNNELISITTP